MSTSSTHEMPWRRSAEPDDGVAIGDGIELIERGDPLRDAVAGLDPQAASEAMIPTEEARRAAEQAGSQRAAEYAQKAGVDIDAAGISETALALTTEEGRTKAMKELGVHMSGRLAERYGVSDPEATKLLESSRALRTREGRAQVMAEYASGPSGEALRTHLTERGLSIEDRRSVMHDALSNGAVTGALKKAGKGILIGGIILLVVLFGILIGAVALLSALFDGGADASALADVVSTRPAAAAFVALVVPA
ncbi:MAG: hypothetical protein ACTHY8_07805 [Microbacterium gubbeenense]|uniref:hypothetical protein n=1 Tax=Microbacterium gubbeenense TaxID=159896 RepID=UPI0004104E0B|nr:hypothetical protein [Microbacterium gubbeenense]